MPTQKESHAKRASISLTPRFHRRGTPASPDQLPTAQKIETNPIYRTAPTLPTRPYPNYAKQTQSQPRRTCGGPKKRNEPNLIPANLRNEPNLGLAPHYSPFTAHHSLFYENEPNSPPANSRNEPNFGPSAPLFTIHRSLFTISRNEPNFRRNPQSTFYNLQYTIPPRPPNHAKRTQFAPRPAFAVPKTRNEPNLHRAGPVEDQKCETNPIPAPLGRSQPHHSPDYAKRTQSQPGKYTKRTQSPPPPSHRPKNCETNPIPTRFGFHPSQTIPHCAKRTQLPRTAGVSPAFPLPLCETNPISAYQVSRSPLFMRNEPNSPLPQPGPRPKYTKRTQLLHHFSSTPLLHYSTTPLLPSHPPNAQNEPNYYSPTPLLHFSTSALISPLFMRNEPNLNKSECRMDAKSLCSNDLQRRLKCMHPVICRIGRGIRQ